MVATKVTNLKSVIFVRAITQHWSKMKCFFSLSSFSSLKIVTIPRFTFCCYCAFFVPAEKKLAQNRKETSNRLIVSCSVHKNKADLETISFRKHTNFLLKNRVSVSMNFRVIYQILENVEEDNQPKLYWLLYFKF